MTPLNITLSETPSEADRDAIIAPLLAYNIARAGDPRKRPVALLLTDDKGAKLGGLWGRIGYDWLFVELLSVPEQHRGSGLGAALMRRAEQVARGEQCVGIWLDTYDFQARGFYEKLGFEVFGAIDDYPPGHQRFFLRKHL